MRDAWLQAFVLALICFATVKSSNPVSVLQGVKDSSMVLHMKPYPHVVVKNALPQHLYEELAATYYLQREEDHTMSDRHLSSVDFFKDPSRFSERWRQFFAYHTSREYLEELWQVFEPALREYYPHLTLDGVNVVGRKDKKGAKTPYFEMDCSFRLYANVKTPKLLGPHFDNQFKLFIGLLYMREPGDPSSGGDLALYSNMTRVTTRQRTVTNYEALTAEALVKYDQNTLVYMLGTSKSIHGITMRSITTVPRKVISISTQYSEQIFELEEKYTHKED